MSINSKLRAIDTHLTWANKLAMDIVESKARSIMNKHTRISEFVMAMGSYCFWDNNQNQMDTGNYKYLQEFDNLMSELSDRELYVTGNPMKLSRYENVIIKTTNW